MAAPPEVESESPELSEHPSTPPPQADKKLRTALQNVLAEGISVEGEGQSYEEAISKHKKKAKQLKDDRQKVAKEIKQIQRKKNTLTKKSRRLVYQRARARTRHESGAR